jgi:hypothetical protein
MEENGWASSHSFEPSAMLKKIQKKNIFFYKKTLAKHVSAVQASARTAALAM